LGELVHQLPWDVTFAYNICLAIIIPHFKDLIEKVENKPISQLNIFVDSSSPLKNHLGPQKGYRSSRPEKLPKIVNCATIKETEKLKETVLGA